MLSFSVVRCWLRFSSLQGTFLCFSENKDVMSCLYLNHALSLSLRFSKFSLLTVITSGCSNVSVLVHTWTSLFLGEQLLSALAILNTSKN